MIESRIVCVDIGSTWTKGAVLSECHDRFNIEKRAVVATTTDYLPDGFYAVLRELLPSYDWRNGSAETLPARLFFSSSAKGGLKIAVVGLVPEMSLHIARLAAFSAGGRVCASFPYRLTESNIRELEESQPDILLLCGGTDGGNEKNAIANACMIDDSWYKNSVIYAGNSAAVDQIREILVDNELIVCENVMPDFGRLNIQPVRDAIRDLFLRQIVSGKGLSELVARFGVEPLPTPLAVYNLVEAMGKNLPDWNQFALIDMGGATTDFYSFCEAYNAEGGTIMKGIVEPTCKRTVEGDLGMRVSAGSVFAAAEKFCSEALSQDHEKMQALREYASLLERQPDYLPQSSEQQAFDQILAGACVHNSLVRHAGFYEEIYTTKGKVKAQTGKDLRGVKKIVGSGGYLAACGRDGLALALPSLPVIHEEKVALIPEKFSYFADCDYVLPLLALLAEELPLQCANTAAHCLTDLSQNIEVKESFYCEFTKIKY